MVIFCRVEHIKFLDLCHDRIGVLLRIVNFLDNLLCNCLLFFITVKDDWSVLSTDIFTLTVFGCWVMNIEEYSEDIIEGNNVRIVVKLYDFSMSCTSSAYLFVSWIGCSTIRITRLDISNSNDPAIYCVSAPKAPSSKCSDLCNGLHLKYDL